MLAVLEKLFGRNRESNPCLTFRFRTPGRRSFRDLNDGQATGMSWEEAWMM